MNRRILQACSLAATWSARRLDYSVLHRRKAVCCFCTSSTRRFLNAPDKDHEEKEKQLIVHQGEYFDKVDEQERNKQTYHQALALYRKRNPLYRRGHVEFIYAALERMVEFSVHRDLSTYKQLMTLFPEGKMVARGPWEVEFMYYPKQQQCAIDVMDMMEMHGIFHVLFIVELIAAPVTGQFADKPAGQLTN